LPDHPFTQVAAKDEGNGESRRILVAGVEPMLATSIDWKSKREELKAKRNPLFKRYLKNPEDTHLALEIKEIDDQIAECTEHMLVKKGKN
jgi:hypothetical protein